MPPEADSSGLEVSGLRCSYPVGLGLRRREVLHGIDLSLARGRCLGLVGPNGSGKSTLLRVLAGVQRYDRGRVRILGVDPTRAWARSRLAFLPEDSPFPEELSALAALDLMGALAGVPRKQVRPQAEQLLERVGLGAQKRDPLRTFSRGMLRRFGLAQAFLSQPQVVFLDEPTAGLDAPGFAVLDDLLTEALRESATLVLASHLPSDLLRHCDDLAVMLDGRLSAHGPAADLLGVKGRVQVELEGLDPTQLEGLSRWVEQAGGKVCSTQQAGRSLLELYGPSPGDGGA